MQWDGGKGRRGLGLSLIEAALALGLAAIALVALMQIMGDGAAQARARAAADRMLQVVEATRGYVRVHYGELAAAAGPGAPLVVPVGKASAEGPVPTGPAGLPSLQGGGFLPSTYVDVNPYGQRHAVLVRKAPSGVLEVMVTTHGGRAIRDADLGRIASRVGAEGGFMMENPPGGASGQVQGAYGGWRAPAAAWSNGMADPSTGRVMAMLGFDNGVVLSDFLYRYDIEGDGGEANRMHAAIDMNGNDIDNVATIRAVADLLRVEQDLQVARDAEVVRNLAVGGDVSAGGALAVEGATELRDGATVTGEVTASGHVTGAKLMPDEASVAGAACSPNGLISRDASGRTLSCVAGAWSYAHPKLKLLERSWSCKDCDERTYNIGKWDMCLLSGIDGPGGLNTRCRVFTNGADWFLTLQDDDDGNETHRCYVTCMEFQ